MRQFTSDELRKTWKQFYMDRGHVDVGAVSLVSDGSTGVMFNVAGMQPLMPYLLGQKHPLGTRLWRRQGGRRECEWAWMLLTSQLQLWYNDRPHPREHIAQRCRQRPKSLQK